MAVAPLEPSAARQGGGGGPVRGLQLAQPRHRRRRHAADHLALPQRRAGRIRDAPRVADGRHQRPFRFRRGRRRRYRAHRRDREGEAAEGDDPAQRHPAADGLHERHLRPVGEERPHQRDDPQALRRTAGRVAGLARQAARRLRQDRHKPHVRRGASRGAGLRDLGGYAHALHPQGGASRPWRGRWGALRVRSAHRRDPLSVRDRRTLRARRDREPLPAYVEGRRRRGARA